MTLADLTLLDWLLLASATLYIAQTVTQKPGPFGLFDRLRAWLRANGETPTVLNCPWCLSIWVGIALYLVYGLFPPLVVVFAVAGLAMMLWSYSGVRHG